MYIGVSIVEKGHTPHAEIRHVEGGQKHVLQSANITNKRGLRKFLVGGSDRVLQLDDVTLLTATNASINKPGLVGAYLSNSSASIDNFHAESLGEWNWRALAVGMSRAASHRSRTHLSSVVRRRR